MCLACGGDEPSVVVTDGVFAVLLGYQSKWQEIVTPWTLDVAERCKLWLKWTHSFS